MTITITKSKLALAVLVAALLLPATAYAAHVFDDVDDSRYFASAVQWAYENDITTGKSATSFAPDLATSRSETVTFLKRYNDNIVDPAIAELQAQIDTNTAAIEGNASSIVGNSSSISAHDDDISGLEALPVTHWAAIAPDGTLIGTSYPGATAEVDEEEFGDEVFVVEFPGLEWIGEEEFGCGVQASAIGSLDLAYAALVLPPGFDTPSSRVLVGPIDLGADYGDFADGAFIMVTITC